MSKSDVCVPSCRVYVQIAFYMSGVQYVCPGLRCVYPGSATCFRFVCNSQVILHISVQFRCGCFADFSRYMFHAVGVSCGSA